ncbi:uncharacterized protein [Venturia canescens]|uniref:uncharacterized protein n=1 Tax=Venturia canescens TaxID=32260 RepID=UPI001C9D031E|nr:uncharacterized protein LOC122407589 [Venturia canescens]
MENSGPNWKEINRVIENIWNDVPEDNTATRRIKELPKEADDDTTEIENVKWDYRYATEATVANTPNGRIIALTKAFWPNEEIRAKLVIKKRTNTDADAVEISEQDVISIKNTAEAMDGIRCFDMEKKFDLRYYKSVISNSIKCLRNRQKKTKTRTRDECRQYRNENLANGTDDDDDSGSEGE